MVYLFLLLTIYIGTTTTPNHYQTKHKHKHEQERDLRHILTCLSLVCFFVPSIFYLLMILITEYTNLFLRVNCRFNASEHCQTEHEQGNEQERGLRHVKTCLNCWYGFLLLHLFLTTYNFIYRFYKHFSRVDHCLDVSEHCQTKHKQRHEQERDSRHVKTCLNCWYFFYYYIFF